jgi:hypothetical protein
MHAKQLITIGTGLKMGETIVYITGGMLITCIAIIIVLMVCK